MLLLIVDDHGTIVPNELLEIGGESGDSTLVCLYFNGDIHYLSPYLENQHRNWKTIKSAAIIYVYQIPLRDVLMTSLHSPVSTTEEAQPPRRLFGDELLGDGLFGESINFHDEMSTYSVWVRKMCMGSSLFEPDVFCVKRNFEAPLRCTRINIIHQTA